MFKNVILSVNFILSAFWSRNNVIFISDALECFARSGSIRRRFRWRNQRQPVTPKIELKRTMRKKVEREKERMTNNCICIYIRQKNSFQSRKIDYLNRRPKNRRKSSGKRYGMDAECKSNKRQIETNRLEKRSFGIVCVKDNFICFF